MYKVFAILALLLFSLGALNSVSHYALACNGFEPSAINKAMGGSPVGVVNYWHNDPLNAYDNPAFPSLHEGFSYSQSAYVFMHDVDTNSDDLEYQAALYSVSYHGIALLLPYLYPQSSSYSSDIDYGEFSFTADGYTVSHYYISDRSNTYGISLNLFEALRLVKQDQVVLPKNTDLAFGMNIIRNTSDIIPSYLPEPAKASSTNLGFLARTKHSLKPDLTLESAVGLSYFNAFSSDINYIDTTSSELIYQRLNMGLSLSLSKDNPYYVTGKGTGAFAKNLYSARLLYGVIDEYADDPMLKGIGSEFGMLDTAFLRLGYHNDEAGNIKGITYGIGINAHYRDYISAVYNYSFFPGGSLKADKKISHYGFSVNFMEIYNEISNSR
ncbi:MAG: hypothetical protein PHY48_03475 [Candidatus Cloacimonetes bacterium]|nr:hypothetical protein [Candidatus Cloacimonadota bacterium]